MIANGLYRHLWLILLALLSLAALPVTAQHLEPVSLQLKWKHEFQFAGFYMAKELGYYRDAGLDVEIREVAPDTHVIDEVLSGRATYGLSDSTLIYERLRRRPVVALAAIFQRSPIALMTLKSSGIKTALDLRGKRLMTFNTENNISLLTTLRSQGVALNEVTLAPHTFDINDLINGTVDAYAVYSSDQPYQLQQRGIEYNLINPVEYGFDFYGDILFTSEQEMASHGNRSQRFRQASLMGWRYALKHIDETIGVIQQKYNSQQRSRELLQFEADVLKQLAESADAPLGTITREKVETIAHLYNVLNIQPAPNNPSETQSVLEGFIFKEGKTFLTPREQQFLASHRIEISSTGTWPPFNVLNSDGHLEGIAIDYWDLIRRNSGIDSRTTVADSWSAVVDNIRNKKAAATVSTTRTREREAFALFSKPYASFPFAIATTHDQGFISDANQLNGKEVAVGKGYTAHNIMAKHYPEVVLIPVKNLGEALDLLSRGEVYAAVDVLPALTYSISQLGYSNLKISGTTAFNFDISIMVRDDYPELVSIINKGIDAISEDQKKVIYNKWVAVNYQKGTDYGLIWRLGLPLLLLLVIFTVWNKRLQREVRRRKALESKYEQLASTDTLTSICNRYKIDNLLTRQIDITKRYQRPLSVIFIDLDGFKHINDTFGHKAGDTTLVSFAKLIQGLIRSSDFFGRWGGEEFMIILPETPINQAVILAEKLRQQVEDFTFDVIGNLTCSFGVTQLTQEDSEESLVARADMGLYQAKRQGKNRVTII